jgi:hypothetical protein
MSVRRSRTPIGRILQVAMLIEDLEVLHRALPFERGIGSSRLDELAIHDRMRQTLYAKQKK